jgi:hypothetical protein
LFEFYTSFKGMTLQDGADRIDMCLVNDIEFKMLYIVDLDGTLRPSAVTTPAPSTLVASDNGELLKFVDTSKCTNVTAGCYQYCSGSCFRSVRYSVAGTGQESYQLKVCLRNDYSRCSLFPGGRRETSGPHTFIAHLPVGNVYDAVFLDGLGQEVIPTTVTSEYEESLCAVEAVFDVALYGNLPARAPVAPAPVVAPVPAPTKVPVAIPVAVPVTAPVAASAPVGTVSIFSGLFLIQTKNGQESPLPSTVTLSSTGTSLSIVAKTMGASVKKVTFKFDGKLIQTELTAPWALKGDRFGKFISYAPLAVRGSHTVVAEAFSSTGSSLGTISRTFSVA